MFCSKCGKQVGDNDQYCASCGSAINYDSNTIRNDLIPPQNGKTKPISMAIFAILIIGTGISVAYFVLPFFMNSFTESNKNTSNKSNDVAKEILLYTVHLKKAVTAYSAPSTESPIDETGKIETNESLFVLSDDGNWLKIRVTIKDFGWHAYIQKHLLDFNTVERIDKTPDEYLLDIKQKKRKQEAQESCDTLESFVTNGVLTSMDIDLNTAMIRYSTWQVFDANQKKNLVLMMSHCFGASGSTSRVNIYDNLTGEKLASYKTLGGVKLYK